MGCSSRKKNPNGQRNPFFPTVVDYIILNIGTNYTYEESVVELERTSLAPHNDLHVVVIKNRWSVFNTSKEGKKYSMYQADRIVLWHW